MSQEHLNESILSEEILEDQKKNRIDHMTYLPGMEVLESDVMDQVVAAMEAYDYDKYTEADVRRALVHDSRTLRISQHCSPLPLCLYWRTSHRQPVWKPESILVTVYTCSHLSTLPTTAKTTAFTAVSTATIKSTVPS